MSGSAHSKSTSLLLESSACRGRAFPFGCHRLLSSGSRVLIVCAADCRVVARARAAMAAQHGATKSRHRSFADRSPRGGGWSGGEARRPAWRDDGARRPQAPRGGEVGRQLPSGIRARNAGIIRAQTGLGGVECCHGWAGCPGGDGRHHFLACRQNRSSGAGKLPVPLRGLSPSPTATPASSNPSNGLADADVDVDADAGASAGGPAAVDRPPNERPPVGHRVYDNGWGTRAPPRLGQRVAMMFEDGSWCARPAPAGLAARWPCWPCLKG